MNKISIHGIRKIDEKWNDQMLFLVKQSPIEANGLKLVLDRHPDIFFIPRLKSKRIECAGFFLKDQLCGFAFVLYKELYVYGAPQTVLYFGNLVVGPSARGKVILYRMSDFFLKGLDDENRLGYAVIMQGNFAASILVNRFHPRFPNIPHFRVIGQWHVKNIFLPFYVRHKSRYLVRHAQPDDLDSIVKLLQFEYRFRLFGPVVDRSSLEHQLNELPDFGIENYHIAENEGEVIGVCCAWDMAPVKKNRVMGYSRPLKWMRCFVNSVAWIFQFPKLPAEGEPFQDVTIIDYAVKDRDTRILKALLLNIYNEYRKKKYHLMLFGHAAGDPISAATRPFVSQTIISDIHIFSKEKQVVDEFMNASFPWIDMTLL
jgi:hypothetical protein